MKVGVWCLGPRDDCLKRRGVDAAMVSAYAAVESKAFLCFERRTSGDVVLGGHKIVGSAQRRRHQAVLQHGSILWQASPAAPHLPGIWELSAGAFTRQDFMNAWLPLLADSLNLRLIAGEMTDLERRRAEEIRQEKYGHPNWIRLR